MIGAMERIKNFTLIESKTHHYLELAIFALAGILSCLISKSYSFNPFILVLVYLSYQRGINTYLISVASMTVTALIVSISYGIEIAILQGVFFFFCIVFCFFKKAEFWKRYGPFILTHAFVAALYLIRFFTWETLANVAISVIASCFLLYGYQSLMRCVHESEREFESRAKVIVMSTASLLFFGISGFYILVTRFLHLIICRTSSTIEGALAIILNCVIIYYLQDASSVILITLLFPGLIAVILNRRYSWIAYLISYLFISIYMIDEFYTSPFFYQGLLGVFFALITPEVWIRYLTSLFTREESHAVMETNERLNTTAESISDIIHYLDIVLDASIDRTAAPTEKALSMIEGKVCKECIRREKCHLASLIRKGLEDDFVREERIRLFEECLYPYKILRNVRLNRTTLANEKKYLEEIQNKNAIYRREMESLYRPLRNVFHNSTVLTKKKTRLQEELEAYHYDVSNLSVSEKGIVFQIALPQKEELNKVIAIISDQMKRTYYLEDMFFILSLNLYEVRLSCEPLYAVELGTVSYGVNEDFNGDTYQSLSENGKFYLMLSDGIGHSRESSYLSMFLVNALSAYRKIEDRIADQIHNVNALLKSKVNDEMYATLDYIEIDEVKGSMDIYKCGSFYSYLYRSGTLTKFRSNTPPLGILYDIQTSPLSKQLADGDILIFMTDGYMDEPERVLEAVLKDQSHRQPEELARALDQKLLENLKTADDKTLIVMKIRKKKVSEPIARKY